MALDISAVSGERQANPADTWPLIHPFKTGDFSDSRARLFALVIGIDDYQNVRKLKGAVSDANTVNAYLRQHLGVPKERVTNLRDKSATRTGIMNAFRSLQRNPDINPQDAILIYFAGHGSEISAPEGWEAGGYKIQVILPQDTGRNASSGQVVHPIPDRTIAALLNGIAREKGDNITVIFDCCHSSSGTRGDKNVPGRVARVVDLQADIPTDLDQDIIAHSELADGRDMIIPAGFLQANLHSHVLLAACGAEELAWETQGRGAFTTALLETLVRTGADKVTYTGLMQRLPNLPNQNPQCEGHNKDRIFLNAKASGAGRFFVSIEQQDNTYILNSGIAQGITVGSEFAVYADHVESPSNTPLCTLRVTSTEAFRATLEPLDDTVPPTLPKPAYARQVGCGPGNELCVHFSEALRQAVSVDSVRRAGLDSHETDIGFILTDMHDAELLLDVQGEGDDRRAAFSTTHMLANDFGLKVLPHVVSLKPEDISKVLRSAARWNWHLKRTNTNAFGGTVRIEFTRLGQVDDGYDEEGMPIMKAIGEDMNRTGVIDMVVNSDHYFGVKIINGTNHDLYPYVFYFDVNDQSIEPYYLGSTSTQRVDPPLRARSSLTVGYGATGSVPFAFRLGDGEEIDVGFLKVFLTTSQTEFGSLKQTSPFNVSRAPFSRDDIVKKLKGPEWDSVMATIVQRAKERTSETPVAFRPKTGSCDRQRWGNFWHRLGIPDRLKSIFFL